METQRNALSRSSPSRVMLTPERLHYDPRFPIVFTAEPSDLYPTNLPADVELDRCESNVFEPSSRPRQLSATTATLMVPSTPSQRERLDFGTIRLNPPSSGRSIGGQMQNPSADAEIRDLVSPLNALHLFTQSPAPNLALGSPFQQPTRNDSLVEYNYWHPQPDNSGVRGALLGGVQQQEQDSAGANVQPRSMSLRTPTHEQLLQSTLNSTRDPHIQAADRDSLRTLAWELGMPEDVQYRADFVATVANKALEALLQRNRVIATKSLQIMTLEDEVAHLQQVCAEGEARHRQSIEKGDELMRAVLRYRQ